MIQPRNYKREDLLHTLFEFLCVNFMSRQNEMFFYYPGIWEMRIIRFLNRNGTIMIVTPPCHHYKIERRQWRERNIFNIPVVGIPETFSCTKDITSLWMSMETYASNLYV